MRLFLFPLALAALLPAAAQAAVVASIDSPGKVLHVDLDINDGHLTWSVSRLGKSVIAPSRMGFRFRNAEQLERNLGLASTSTSTFDDTWEQPWGENRLVRNHYNELRARFTETTRGKRSIDVTFRVYDDGLGFRYGFPDQPQLKDVVIDDELTEFDVAPKATAWWIPAGEWNRYEYPYNRTPLAEVGQAHTPMTIKTDDGLYIAFHEAALAAGGTDNGSAGIRDEYHEHYYGAFVLDPDGNNVEAVCHKPED